MRLRSRHNSGGFTLVELLVVIAIIGVLVSILLPAVQMAREAARRMQCASNLKQLSLGIINYENSLRTLPAAGIVNIGTTPPTTSTYEGFMFHPRTGKMFSWAVLVLPYMEQKTLHDQFDFNVSVLDQKGNPQAEQPPLLLCPSDGARDRVFYDEELTEGKIFGKGNYAAFCSTFHVDIQDAPMGIWAFSFPGAIVNHGQPIKDITDGTSSTLMLAEVRTRDQHQDQRGAWALPWAGAALITADRHAEYGEPFVPKESLKGLSHTPNQQTSTVDVIYHCENPVEARWDRMPCKTQEGSYPNEYCSAATRSLHPGGVNASFVDGRVAFLPDDIDEDIMAFMVCTCDGRVYNVQDHVR